MTKKFSKYVNNFLKESLEFKKLLGIDENQKKVSVCAWCDKDKKIADLFESKGYSISHGVCPAHEKMLEDSLSG